MYGVLYGGEGSVLGHTCTHDAGDATVQSTPYVHNCGVLCAPCSVLCAPSALAQMARARSVESVAHLKGKAGGVFLHCPE